MAFRIYAYSLLSDTKARHEFTLTYERVETDVPSVDILRGLREKVEELGYRSSFLEPSIFEGYLNTQSESNRNKPTITF